MINTCHIIFTLNLLIILVSSNNYPKCRNYQQACAVELMKFPELVNDERDDIKEGHNERNDESVSEGSGENNDDDKLHFVPMSMSFPIYDEFVPTTPTYDYSMEPVEKVQHQICSCLDDEECGKFDSIEQTLELSNHIRISFCRPLDKIFNVKCKGMRSLARVIGRLDMETGDRLVHVNDTLIFCRCESNKWIRMMIEPWINDMFSFSYICI
ncbi:unnamed protein product [Meloidogyne enterolobii]|uniref:Uncharacterized protein n=1 Tax=Meloidogyne enterolobii TaxID=390850 RepID=A0ACB1B7Y3_MELEN